MRRMFWVLATGAVVVGCSLTGGEPERDERDEREELDEIIDNLVAAGFPAADIQRARGKVYVGRDGEVSLAASREMLEPHPGMGTILASTTAPPTWWARRSRPCA
jgi:hypothetical protein